MTGRVARRVREIARSATQRYGTRGLKTWLWDKDFSRGRYGQSTEGDLVYPYLEKYASGGCILDLGCGSGNTGTELRAEAYREYVGVDISRVAVARGAAKSERAGRSRRNHYVCADILTYIPPRKFEVILFRDSIYYLPWPKIKATLDRYSSFVKESGVLIVRICDGLGRYKQIVDDIERNFAVIQRHESDQPSAVLLVFRRREQSALAASPAKADIGNH